MTLVYGVLNQGHAVVAAIQKLAERPAVACDDGGSEPS